MKTPAAISEPVAPELVEPSYPDVGSELSLDMEEAIPEETEERKAPSGKFQSPESSGDDLEDSLNPMETEPEPADEEPATIQDKQENIISPKGEPRQEGIGKSAKNPEAQTESPQKPSDSTLEAMLEMFKE